jgi:cytochrome c553
MADDEAPVRVKHPLRTLGWVVLVVTVGLGVHFGIQGIIQSGDYYASESPVLPKLRELEDSDPQRAALVRAGMVRYNESCRLCHHRDGHGGEFTPSLVGHNAAGVEAMLRIYRDGHKVGPLTALMAPWAEELSDEEIHKLSLFIELL